VYSDTVEIVFKKPIYVESFFLRINGAAAQQMRLETDSEE